MTGHINAAGKDKWFPRLPDLGISTFTPAGPGGSIHKLVDYFK
jgi:hypothetical protein